MKHLSILSATTLLIVTLMGCQEEETSRVLPNYPVARVAPPDPDPWQLVWSDEFQYAGKPDPSKWRYEWGYVRNQELQYYTNRPENVRVVDNEYLVIEARRDSAVVDGEVREITSASLNTRYKHSWQYGKLEIRAQIPSSLGTWPALWMLPDSYQKVPWPLCGEIDIMEHVGYDPDYVHTTIHTEAYNHRKKTQKGLKTFLPDIVEQFHTYGIEWNAQKIDFFVDRNLVFTVNKESGDTEEEWPFDQPFYLIMNLAFGGAWGGSQGVDKSSLPQKCLIDYVRVYQARDTLTTRDSTVTVRARGHLGNERLYLEVDGHRAATWGLSTDLRDYTYSGDVRGKNLKVAFTNEKGGSYYVQVDHLRLDDQMWQAEEQSSNTGVWQNDGCGGGYSEYIHCPGAIDFGTLD